MLRDVRQPAPEGGDLFTDPIGMSTCSRCHLEKFLAILRIVHLLGMLLKPLQALHLFDIPLAQKIDSVGRLLGIETKKPSPPFRPVIVDRHENPTIEHWAETTLLRRDGLDLRPSNAFFEKQLTSDCFELLFDLLPVHHLPPIRDVIGALIMVLEVVGVFPYIQTQNWQIALRKRRILVQS